MTAGFMINVALVSDRGSHFSLPVYTYDKEVEYRYFNKILCPRGFCPTVNLYFYIY